MSLWTASLVTGVGAIWVGMASAVGYAALRLQRSRS
jgi:hypothetical protein